MEIIRHISRCASLPHPVVSLGNFDGVHIGHQAILRRLLQEAQARQGTALVLTFHPHPLTVLRPTQPLPLICNLREKLSAFAALQIDKVLLQHFTPAFAQLTPEEFVRRYLKDAIGAEKVVVGHNVSFGRHRAGNAEVLQQLGKSCGFEVDIVGPVTTGGQEVSSTAVRTLLTAGEMREVTRFLGRPYAASGRVVKGFQRGRTIGFPTANLRPRTDLLLPNGVYAVTVNMDGQKIPGVANVGMNPTFNGNQRTLEAHLFDFSGDLYGRRLTVSFVARLRGERKFPSVEELVKQIQEDATRARALLLPAQP
jgi:riboflavin kinase/FMN adenylyltransferase